MDTSKVNRIEVIDHTHTLEEDGGRVFTYWHGYDKADKKDVNVEIQLQDDDRTLKVFIK